MLNQTGNWSKCNRWPVRRGGTCAGTMRCMWSSPGNLFRGLILLLLAAHVFCMYSLARTWDGAFGFHLGQTVLAAVFGLIMLIPLLWSVTVPEWPEIFSRHIRGRRRFHAGRCPGCNYDLHDRGLGDEKNCAECGEPFRAPEPYRFTPRIFRVFIAINIVAWTIGCGGAEAMLQIDETAFHQEAKAAAAAGEMGYGRPRRWPGVGGLYWESGREYNFTRDRIPPNS